MKKNIEAFHDQIKIFVIIKNRFNYYIRNVNYLFKNRLEKFQKDRLKTVRENKFLMKQSFFFAFLLWSFLKEPFKLSDIVPSYLKNKFNFIKR